MSVQQTLTGEEADERERPKTMLYCGECDAHILRSHRHDHAHDLYESRSDYESAGRSDSSSVLDDDDEGDIGDEDEVVGEVYDVDIRMEAKVTARVVAPCESDAKEKAEELRLGDREDVTGNVPEARLTMTLHKDASSVQEVTRGDEELAERMEGWPW